jgi:putative N6-adenine-specific DNA methylase
MLFLLYTFNTICGCLSFQPQTYRIPTQTNRHTHNYQHQHQRQHNIVHDRIHHQLQLPFLKSTYDDYDFNTDEAQSQQQQPNDNIDVKEYFATCIPGLSSVLANELISIGADNVEISGTSGVKFTSNIKNKEEEDMGMKAFMYVRTAHRIMELIISSETNHDDNSNDYNYIYEEHNEFDDYTPTRITNRDTLYNFIQDSITSPALQNLLGNGKGGLLTLNVNTIMNNMQSIPKDLCHSHYSALTVKNAFVDKVRDLRSDGVRPDVDLNDPDVPFMVVLRGVNDEELNRRRPSKNRRGKKNSNNYNDYDSGGGRGGGRDDDIYKSVNVSLYRILHSGGSSLHRRGYRSSTNAIHKAAMKESLASGLLLESGWDKLCYAARYKDGLPAVLVDPMCGSGTFCVEAAMIASDYAPGLMRMRCYDKNGGGNDGSRDKWNPHYIPPVVRWKDSNRKYWSKLVGEAKDRAQSGMEWMRGHNENNNGSNCVLMANELNPDAHGLANANIINSGFQDFISLHQGDCIDWEIQDSVIPGRTIVASNPPWGLRLDEGIEDSWLSLKSFLRDQCDESEAWVLSGSKSATRYLRMKKTRSVVIKTAGEDLRWIQYHVFKKKAPEEVPQVVDSFDG